MHDQSCPGILLVKLFSHAGDKHNRKFQAFALVDTHDLHSILILGKDVGLSEIHLILLQVFYISDKIKQSSVTGALIISGLLKQHEQICLLLLSGCACPDIVKKSCPIINLPQKLMHRRVGNLTPDAPVQLQESMRFSAHLSVIRIFRIPETFRCQQRLIHPCLLHFPAHTFDTGQLPHGKSSRQIAKRAGKRNVLQRIVQNTQVVQHSHDLRRGKIPRLCGDTGRNPLCIQNTLKGLRPAGQGPEQDHTVPIYRRAVLPRDLIENGI